jgi:DNA-binding transcriptional regulator of glucitol operon
MAFTLRWLPRHLAMLIIVAAFSLLGRWQWDVSNSARGGLQNLLYALQWWTMAAIIIYGWWRLLHDAVHGRPEPKLPVATGASAWPHHRPLPSSELIDAQLANEEPDETDEELARYNEYLASLNRRAENAR